MKLQPMVSVVMITYGHENFIQQAIEGVLMQVCDFDVELIVANDCSPDQTDFIIKNFIQNHPNGNWIKYFNHEKNLGMMPNFNFALGIASGKYIAMCEGDDYWTDPFKLQKQVDFLEDNPKSVLCFHQISKLFEDGSIVEQKSSQFHTNITNRKHLINVNYIATVSVVFRNDSTVFDRLAKFGKLSLGDYPLYFSLLTKPDDEILFIDELMAVYRAGRPESASNAIHKKIFHHDCIKIYKTLPIVYQNLTAEDHRSICNGLAREYMNLYKRYMEERIAISASKYLLNSFICLLRLKFLKGYNSYDFSLNSFFRGFKSGLKSYIINRKIN